MRRIAVIGSPGAGKSTLARELADRLEMPLYHLDRLFWQPGWVALSRSDWVALQEKLVALDEWIIDGNYAGTMGLRLARAELVVFLDYSRWVCLWGAVRRWLQYMGRVRPDLTPGCPEKLDWEFLQYIWRFPREGRVSVEAKLVNLPVSTPVVRLRSRRETAAFLDQLAANAGDYGRIQPLARR